MDNRFKQIDLTLRKSFEKIKIDIGRLEDQSRITMNDLSVIRQNLFDYNNLKTQIELLEKRVNKLERKKIKEPEEREEIPKRRGLFSRIFGKKLSEEDELYQNENKANN